LKLIFKTYYIYFIFISIISILFTACEDSVDDNIFNRNSKIWVDAVICNEDTVKLFVGTTSGMNSGNTAEYRSDAHIDLFVNDSEIPLPLKFKNINDPIKKGYYYYPRLTNVKVGDSLRFKAFIENSDFLPVQGKTTFPAPVRIAEIKLNATANPYNKKRKIVLDILLDTNQLNKTSGYMELKFYNEIYSKIDSLSEIPEKIEIINSLNNIDLKEGIVWNEKFQSVFFDCRDLDNSDFKVSFWINDEFVKNNIRLELRTIYKDYFQYCRAIDAGSIGNSNIINGAGIFTGISKDSKTIKVK
jgi:hypothetical protein